MTSSPKNALLEKVNKLTWYHNIDLGNGVVTPGRGWHQYWDPSTKFMEKADIAGKHVLEIGTWDGYFSFKAEALGAEKVIATDIKPWETFMLAREILESKVDFKVASIYNIDNVFPVNSFDVVICYGIYYHLLFPAFGLFKLNRVLRPNGILLLEGAFTKSHETESLYHFAYGADNITEDDPTFCFNPTIKCLKNMLHATLYNVIEVDPYLQNGDSGRILTLAQKREKTQNDQLYEHLYPDFLMSDLQNTV